MTPEEFVEALRAEKQKLLMTSEEAATLAEGTLRVSFDRLLDAARDVAREFPPSRVYELTDAEQLRGEEAHSLLTLHIVVRALLG
jgi:hypothetical protein